MDSRGSSKKDHQNIGHMTRRVEQGALGKSGIPASKEELLLLAPRLKRLSHLGIGSFLYFRGSKYPIFQVSGSKSHGS